MCNKGARIVVDKSQNFTLLVRVGYAARALVYILLGYLALSSAGDVAAGPAASFERIREVPLGTAMLYLVAIGLLAYAVYKLIAAISDTERQGADADGIARRIGYFASGIAHIALAWTAFSFAQGGGSSAGQDGSTQAAGGLLGWDAGPAVLGIFGLGLLIAAAAQAREAVTAGFMRRVGAGAPAAIKPIGRAGYAARAVIFLLIGWSLIRSAWFEDGAEVKGLGSALASLQGNELLYIAVAIGLLLFGIFSLIVARYQIIPDLDRGALKPSLR